MFVSQVFSLTCISLCVFLIFEEKKSLPISLCIYLCVCVQQVSIQNVRPRLYLIIIIIFSLNKLIVNEINGSTWIHLCDLLICWLIWLVFSFCFFGVCHHHHNHSIKSFLVILDEKQKKPKNQKRHFPMLKICQSLINHKID